MPAFLALQFHDGCSLSRQRLHRALDTDTNCAARSFLAAGSLQATRTPLSSECLPSFSVKGSPGLRDRRFGGVQPDEDFFPDGLGLDGLLAFRHVERLPGRVRHDLLDPLVRDLSFSCRGFDGFPDLLFAEGLAAPILLNDIDHDHTSSLTIISRLVARL